MKLVRESINEIRQDRESGLGALGVGRAGMCRAFIGASKIDPVRMLKTTTLANNHWIFNDGMRDFKPTIAMLLEDKPENIGIQNVHDFSPKLLTYFESLIFSEGKEHDTEKNTTKYELRWASSRVTEMEITTNKEMGACYVTYKHDGGNRVEYCCFRMP